MKIGLIDVDGHNFPNLALMKISAYHKAKGDDVEWCNLFCHYDVVYQSKVFDDTYTPEFVCTGYDKLVHCGTTNRNVTLQLVDEHYNTRPITNEFLNLCCLSYKQLEDYSKGGDLYALHITDVKLYNKPKDLSEFFVIDKEFLKECPYRLRVYNNPNYTNGALLKGSYVCNNSFEPDFCRGQCGSATKPLTRPPQSWCYVEEV